MTFEQNYSKILTLIRSLERQYQRQPDSVKLLAVSKQQPVDAIETLYAAGQRDFGENYLQEALPKISALQEKNITWHFIGPIQSNKAPQIAEHFHWVQSVSREKVAQILDKHRPENTSPINVCIQVNIDNSPHKQGIALDELEDFAIMIQSLPHLRLRGVMALPEPQNGLFAQQQPFKILKAQFDRLVEKGFALDTLSIGMSQDLEAAISQGATMVRVGTALFGKRPSVP